MARELAESTLDKFRSRLEVENSRLSEILEELEEELETSRMTETAAERSPDPGNAEAGSMKFEYEKERSLGENTRDLLRQVEHAQGRLDAGKYGICERCGKDIPVARLEAIPYATLCVEDAARR
ncbi:MAG: hypothetical protein GEU79_08860 [Acidimicrobiia bacterium]|nr:hypothetical protein [Acidimicrobiia bacterium]